LNVEYRTPNIEYRTPKCKESRQFDIQNSIFDIVLNVDPLTTQGAASESGYRKFENISLG